MDLFAKVKFLWLGGLQPHMSWKTSFTNFENCSHLAVRKIRLSYEFKKATFQNFENRSHLAVRKTHKILLPIKHASRRIPVHGSGKTRKPITSNSSAKTITITITCSMRMWGKPDWAGETPQKGDSVWMPDKTALRESLWKSPPNQESLKTTPDWKESYWSTAPLAMAH